MMDTESPWDPLIRYPQHGLPLNEDHANQFVEDGVFPNMLCAPRMGFDPGDIMEWQLDGTTNERAVVLDRQSFPSTKMFTEPQFQQTDEIGTMKPPNIRGDAEITEVVDGGTAPPPSAAPQPMSSPSSQVLRGRGSRQRGGRTGRGTQGWGFGQKGESDRDSISGSDIELSSADEAKVTPDVIRLWRPARSREIQWQHKNKDKQDTFWAAVKDLYGHAYIRHAEADLHFSLVNEESFNQWLMFSEDLKSDTGIPEPTYAPICCDNVPHGANVDDLLNTLNIRDGGRIVVLWRWFDLEDLTLVSGQDMIPGGDRLVQITSLTQNNERGGWREAREFEKVKDDVLRELYETLYPIPRLPHQSLTNPREQDVGKFILKVERFGKDVLRINFDGLNAIRFMRDVMWKIDDPRVWVFSWQWVAYGSFEDHLNDTCADDGTIEEIKEPLPQRGLVPTIKEGRPRLPTQFQPNEAQPTLDFTVLGQRIEDHNKQAGSLNDTPALAYALETIDTAMKCRRCRQLLKFANNAERRTHMRDRIEQHLGRCPNKARGMSTWQSGPDGERMFTGVDSDLGDAGSPIQGSMDTWTREQLLRKCHNSPTKELRRIIKSDFGKQADRYKEKTEKSDRLLEVARFRLKKKIEEFEAKEKELEKEKLATKLHQRRADRLEIELQSSKPEVERLTQENEAQNTELVALRAQLLKHDPSGQLVTLTKENQDQRAQLASERAQLKQVTKKLADSEKARHATDTELINQKSDNQSLTMKYDDIRNKFDVNTQQILERRVERLRISRDKFRTQLKMPAKKKKKEGWGEDVSSSEDTDNGQGGSSSGGKGNTTSAEDSKALKTAKKRLTQLQDRLVELEEHRNNAITQLIHLQNSSIHSGQQMATMTKDNTDLKAEVARYKGNPDKVLQDQNQKLTGDLNTANTRIKQLEKLESTCRTRRTELEKEVTTLKANTDQSLRQQIKDLTKEVNDNKAFVANLNQQIANLTTNASQGLKDQVRDITRERDAAKQRIVDLEKQEKDCMAKKAELDKQIAAFVAQLDQGSKDMIAKLSAERDSAQNQAANVQLQLDNARATHLVSSEGLGKKILTLESTVKKLQSTPQSQSPKTLPPGTATPTGTPPPRTSTTPITGSGESYYRPKSTGHKAPGPDLKAPVPNARLIPNPYPFGAWATTKEVKTFLKGATATHRLNNPLGRYGPDDYKWFRDQKWTYCPIDGQHCKGWTAYEKHHKECTYPQNFLTKELRNEQFSGGQKVNKNPVRYILQARSGLQHPKGTDEVIIAAPPSNPGTPNSQGSQTAPPAPSPGTVAAAAAAAAGTPSGKTKGKGSGSGKASGSGSGKGKGRRSSTVIPHRLVTAATREQWTKEYGGPSPLFRQKKEDAEKQAAASKSSQAKKRRRGSTYKPEEDEELPDDHAIEETKGTTATGARTSKRLKSTASSQQSKEASDAGEQKQKPSKKRRRT